MKVSIIGAGNVGATAAMKIASENFVDELVLLDIKEGVAEGKAMDIMQSLMMAESNTTNVIGTTNDYSKTENSDVIVITSGVPRKPNMTREELVGINSGVVKSVMENISEYCDLKNTIFVVVSNPMDTMCMVVKNFINDKFGETDDFESPYNDHVIGMGGILDSSRFKYNILMKLREKMPNAGWEMNEIDTAYVVGGHGDTTMIPVVEHAKANGFRLSKFLSEKDINDIVEKTMKGGAILTNMLGTSAWEAPAQGICETVKSILLDEHRIIPSSTWSDAYKCYIGQLAEISREGVYNLIWEYEKFDRVQKKLLESAEAIRKVNENI